MKRGSTERGAVGEVKRNDGIEVVGMGVVQRDLMGMLAVMGW